MLSLVLKYIKILPVFSFLLIANGCEENVKNKDKKIFKYNQSSGIVSLDPAFSKDQATIWACTQLYNGLVSLDDSLSVIPAIASYWEISDSGKSYTFHLRKDVWFHKNDCFKNGSRKVNAYDFVYSFSRIVDPKVASPGSWIFSEHIDSSNPFTAIDSFTFNIKLKKPFLPLMGILTMTYCSVIPKEAVDMYGLDWRSNPVGTGPFQFKKWKEGVALILIKNNNYFEFENNHRLPFIDGVKITFITDKKTEFLSFKAHQLDFISGIDASYIDEVLDETGNLKSNLKNKFILEKSPYLNTEYLGFNTSLTNTNNKQLRQAINYGIDRGEIIRYLRNGVGKEAVYGFVPMGLPSFNSTQKVASYDPQKAITLLKNIPKAQKENISLYTNETYKEIGLMVSKQLSKIGLDVKLEVNPGSVLREWMVKGTVGFFRGSWIADYPDAESYYAVFYSKNGCPPNYTRFSNNDYDKIYENALSETNQSKRFDLYHKLDDIINEETPLVPLYYDEVLRFYHNNIVGLNGNGLNILKLKTVKINS